MNSDFQKAQSRPPPTPILPRANPLAAKSALPDPCSASRPSPLRGSLATLASLDPSARPSPRLPCSLLREPALRAAFARQGAWMQNRRIGTAQSPRSGRNEVEQPRSGLTASGRWGRAAVSSLAGFPRLRLGLQRFRYAARLDIIGIRRAVGVRIWTRRGRPRTRAAHLLQHLMQRVIGRDYRPQRGDIAAAQMHQSGDPSDDQRFASVGGAELPAALLAVVGAHVRFQAAQHRKTRPGRISMYESSSRLSNRSMWARMFSSTCACCDRSRSSCPLRFASS